MDYLKDLLPKARVLLAPAAILVLAWIALYLVPSLEPAQVEMIRVSPYLAAVTGMLLAVHFHRGRPFFLLLLLALFYWCYGSFLAGGLEGDRQQALYHALCSLIPANIFVFALLKERGAFTEAGKFRLLALAGQAFVAFFIFHYHFREIAPLFEVRLLTLVSLDPLHISHFAFLLFLAAAIGLVALAVRRKTPLDVSLLGFLLALFFACNWLAVPHAATLFSLAAGLIVIAGILRDSYNLAFRDDLTGISSRRALNEALNGLGRDFAVAMVDVDHFKKFNDSYGHDVGDQVLKLVAKMLTGVGCGGKAYRYGGEEFTILFEGQKVSAVVPFLEALRQEIAGYRMIIRAADRPRDDREGRKRGTGSKGRVTANITVSIGVAERGPDRQTPEDVIIAADKALYRAKDQGRNQVCRA